MLHEEEIKELKDYKQALDDASIVAITDIHGTITYVNEQFCKISKYTKEELIGKNHRILKSGAHNTEFYTNIWQTISQGKIWRGEIKNKAKDNSFYWVHTTIVPFLKADGSPYQYIAIRTDITQQKKAEEKVKEEQLKLLQSEKLASLGEMAAGISHELGNPIAAIRGRAELLNMQLKTGEVDKEKVQNSMHTIIELIDRMSRIIRGMRSLARDGSQDDYTRVPIGQLINDILEFSWEKYIKKSIQIRKFDLDENLYIECRETQISQVIVNILNNACDAIETLEEKWISIELQSLAENIEIRIMDSGTQIPLSIQKKILQPFFTTKEVGKGTGLGLSISKSIIDNHSGKLFIDRDQNNTCFVISLPKKQNRS